MELTKSDSKMTKGLAIIFMVLLHLFCFKDNQPYTSLIYIGSVPLVYYIGLFGDCCVAIYCFCSGYAHALIKQNKGKNYYSSVIKKLLVFLVNFWLVLLIFCAVGLAVGSNEIPYDFKCFISTVLLYRISYNGSWWFVVIYAVLCVLSPVILKITNKSTLLSLILFTAIYVVSYAQRFGIITLPTANFELIYKYLPLLGTSLLPYAVGALFYKHKVFTLLSSKLSRLKTWHLNVLLLAFFAAMFLAHCIIQTLFVAVFTGIGTVLCFNLWKKPKWLVKVFEFFGNQSTNIWLTHMFFFLVLFRDFIYVAKYPLPILMLMLAITTAISLVINEIMKLLKKTVLKKLM